MRALQCQLSPELTHSSRVSPKVIPDLLLLELPQVIPFLLPNLQGCLLLKIKMKFGDFFLEKLFGWPSIDGNFFESRSFSALTSLKPLTGHLRRRTLGWSTRPAAATWPPVAGCRRTRGSGRRPGGRARAGKQAHTQIRLGTRKMQPEEAGWLVLLSLPISRLERVKRAASRWRGSRRSYLAVCLPNAGRAGDSCLREPSNQSVPVRLQINRLTYAAVTSSCIPHCPSCIGRRRRQMLSATTGQPADQQCSARKPNKSAWLPADSKRTSRAN